MKFVANFTTCPNVPAILPANLFMCRVPPMLLLLPLLLPLLPSPELLPSLVLPPPVRVLRPDLVYLMPNS